jgi:hypothetical protein
MERRKPIKPTPRPLPRTTSARSAFWGWSLAAGFLLVLMISILLPRQRAPETTPAQGENAAANPARPTRPHGHLGESYHPGAAWFGSAPTAPPSARQIVADKVKLFSRKRRDLVHAMSQRLNQPVPADVDKLFDLLEAGGDWDAIKEQYREIAKRAGRYDYSTSHDPDVEAFWRPVQEAFGAAEQAHLWAPQQLLDYGNAILNSLSPGMAYIGGTDGGCFIPTMLNETSEDGESHVMFTQNALADSQYLKYLNCLYGDQLALPSDDQTAAAFQQYTEDARARLLHDQQFPDEPQQLKPGEDISVDSDGKTQVRGQVAVMTINGLLLQDILKLNPNLNFAMEESFPLPATYNGGTPLGPIYELAAADSQNAPNTQNTLTSESVAQSLNYWTATAQQLLADPASAQSDAGLKTWSHDLVAEGNLFAGNQFTSEAEQAYELATQLWPGDLEATYHYTQLLLGQNRLDDAAQVVARALNSTPDNQQLQNLAQQIAKLQAAPH